MKIIHLNISDISGGASQAVYRLHTGLRRLGHNSMMFVADRQSDDPTVIAFKPPPRPVGPMDLSGRLRRRLGREFTRLRRRLGQDPPPPLELRHYRDARPAGYDYFSDDRSPNGPAIVDQLPVGQIMHLHWVGANFLDYRSFFHAVPARTPVVWTLHDMNAFTGGCHYDDGCGRYNTGCGMCPQLGSNEPEDLSNEIWRRKQEIYSQIKSGRFHIVAPSRWLTDKIRESTLLENWPATTIPYGLNTDNFTPRDCDLARNVLGIPRKARVLLFVATLLKTHRKGFDSLVQALTRMKGLSDLFLVSIGRDKPPVDIETPHLHLGRIDIERLLSLIYSAADLFVIPSRQDNLPNTMLEAIACGTPVVGFDVGGIPDVVRPGVTGLLAPSGDVDALAQAIRHLLQNPALRAELAANCRRIAVAEYSLEIQARRYVELYESMIAE